MLRSGYIFRQEIQEYAMFDWEGTPCNTRDSVLDGNDLLRSWPESWPSTTAAPQLTFLGVNDVNDTRVFLVTSQEVFGCLTCSNSIVFSRQDHPPTLLFSSLVSFLSAMFTAPSIAS